MSTSHSLQRKFFERPAEELAPLLLNKVLAHNGVSGRIVEVEAYDGANDPASHAYRGITERNAVMFGPAGHLYVYFTYGMHFCANVVSGPEGVASAVLLRALKPIDGTDEMLARRKPVSEQHLTSGPAKLCQALAIDRAQNGADLLTGHVGVRLVDDGVVPPPRPGMGARVGIKAPVDRQWRWWVPGDPNVSSGHYVSRRPLQS